MERLTFEQIRALFLETREQMKETDLKFAQIYIVFVRKRINN